MCGGLTPLLGMHSTDSIKRFIRVAKICFKVNFIKHGGRIKLLIAWENISPNVSSHCIDIHVRAIMGTRPFYCGNQAQDRSLHTSGGSKMPEAPSAFPLSRRLILKAINQSPLPRVEVRARGGTPEAQGELVSARKREFWASSAPASDSLNWLPPRHPTWSA